MRVGEIPVHYGKDFFKYAIESIAPFVDKVAVLYTPKPSYVYSNAPAFETEEELRACCDGINNLIWHRGDWHSEVEHRNAVLNVVPDTDLIIRVDTDEIFCEGPLKEAIAFAEKSPARNFLVGGFVHLYRSFDYACRDHFCPVRLIRPKGAGDATIPLERSVIHCGYAIRPETMLKKWAIHGHRAELRNGWFENIWMKNIREDCHPVCNGLWNAKFFDRELLPSSLQEHPFYNLNIIE